MGPSRRAAAIRPSLIRRLFDARKPTTANLGLGEPGMPVPMELLDAGVRRYREKRLGYTPNAGLVELRESIAKHYHHPAMPAAKNVIVTVGLEEALFSTLMAVADPGDEIVITDPAFLAYRTVAELVGLTVKAVPTARDRGFALDPEALAAAVGPRTRAILVNSPCNPTGCVDSREALKELARATESSGVCLISDEVYQEIYFGDQRPESLGAFTDRAVILGALSKSCSMTGFRLGWALAPDSVAPAIAAVHQFNVTCAPTISQHLALEAFEHPDWLAATRAQFARQRAVMLDGAARLGLPFAPPDGGFFLFLDVRSLGLPSLTLSERLLAEADVVTVPGIAFGDNGEGFLRLSYAGREDEIAVGMQRIADLFARL